MLKAKTDDNGNAMVEYFLEKTLLSSNSSRCSRTVAVGKKGETMFFCLLFLHTAAGGAIFFFSL